LAVPEEKATDADKKRIAELEQYFSECGYVEPPEEQKPGQWQPGFDAFLRQLTRDLLELDFVAVRKWSAASHPKEFPIAAFACDDAGMIRKRRRKLVGIHKHKLQWEEYEPLRKNDVNEEKMYVRVIDEGAFISDEYTASEMFTGFMRTRTDNVANGYGFSVLEQAMNSINIWIAARDYNKIRFDKDSLPRGFMTLLGNFSPQVMSSFTQQWRQMNEGVQRRWTIPILQAPAQQGTAANWTTLDMSNRDMEYGTFLFTVGVWLHAAFSIHPDETGFSASSPFRPPLSEASPDTNLQYSQDKGLEPILRFIAEMLTRQILWVIQPDRRYVFEFVGSGDWDELQDAQARQARLNAGLTTWGIEWDEQDMIRPDAIKDHPFWDMNPAFLAAMQQFQTMSQQQQQADMAQQAQEAQLSQQGQQQQMLSQDPEQVAQAQVANRPGAQESGATGPGNSNGAVPPVAESMPAEAQDDPMPKIGKSIAIRFKGM
jgi:hypothetical protein